MITVKKDMYKLRMYSKCNDSLQVYFMKRNSIFYYKDTDN